jgi:hypothetical protein
MTSASAAHPRIAFMSVKLHSSLFQFAPSGFVPIPSGTSPATSVERILEGRDRTPEQHRATGAPTKISKRVLDGVATANLCGIILAKRTALARQRQKRLLIGDSLRYERCNIGVISPFAGSNESTAKTLYGRNMSALLRTNEAQLSQVRAGVSESSQVAPQKSLAFAAPPPRKFCEKFDRAIPIRSSGDGHCAQGSKREG